MDSIIQALKRVPPTELQIFALVRESTDENGDLDLEKLTFRMAELKTAIEEAHAYAESTRKAISWLRNLYLSST